jgi:hypothetical protein
MQKVLVYRGQFIAQYTVQKFNDFLVTLHLSISPVLADVLQAPDCTGL